MKPMADIKGDTTADIRLVDRGRHRVAEIAELTRPDKEKYYAT